MPDPVAFLIGIPCIAILVYLVLNADAFGDGNIGAGE